MTLLPLAFFAGFITVGLVAVLTAALCAHFDQERARHG
jgi:uncharacterized membrane protein